MNLPPTDMDNAQPSVSEAKRFTYPGGSRPLDGFTIKRGVGHGGFGEVYYATSDAGKEVALKLIRRSLDVELRGIKQCLNLKHPNLLGVFDIKEDSRGDHWVVMEYVAGDCLDEVIARHPDGMPAAEALAWLSGIAAGVGYLHDHGIVHRDLKPANIFSEEGHVTIGDYGLSKFISCSRRSGHTESVGTVHYMAPEIANGRYGKEIDVYALGVIFYEMLTGRLPFEGESVGEVLMKHLTAKPDVSMIAEPYRSVIARALEKDPEQRFGSVDEMLAQLPLDRAAHRLPCAAGSASANGWPGTMGGFSALATSPACATGSASAPGPVVAGPVDEEPILREVRAFWTSFKEWWRGLNPGAQVAFAILGIIGLIATAGTWLPLGLLALVSYGAYRLARAIVLAGGQSRTPARASGVPPAEPPNGDKRPGGTGERPVPHGQTPFATRRRYRRFRPYEQPVCALIVKSPVERAADLLGSMLLAAVVAGIMTLVTATLTAALSWEVPLEVFAFIFLVSVLGSWAVLVPSKFWEGTEGDGVVRRLVMMTLGIAVGGFAWGCMSWLAVDTASLERFPEYHYNFLAHYARAGGQYPLALSLVAFGTLMLLVRWWRQADPLRHVRMSLWAMATSMAAAFIAALVWQAHGWALVTIAGIMSLAVQLSSPWVNLRLRRPDPEV